MNGGRRRTWTRASLAASLAGVVACSGATPSPTSSIPRGGTLRVAVPAEGFYPEGYAPPDKTTLDLNSAESAIDAFELWRCCLARTLLGYNGKPTEGGGADLRPDLTAGSPEVSADGLTWTFHLKSNLRYAPPLQGTEITAADFIRALQRLARVGFIPPYFEAIDGFRAYAKGSTESIAGLANTRRAHSRRPAHGAGGRSRVPDEPCFHIAVASPAESAECSLRRRHRPRRWRDRLHRLVRSIHARGSRTR